MPGKRTPAPIGANIKYYREKLGWNQTQLAEQSGISQGQISQMESGGRQATRMEVGYKLAKALGVTMEQLYKERTATDD